METLFTSLEEAARVGDVNALRKLLEEDRLLLERVMARRAVGDNPLHIAALLGHADFAAVIINMKPDLTKQRNGHGLSPLHLAAAHGHLPVVKELLKAGSELCLAREEKEGLMPLHVAVINGKTPIIKELVEACEAAFYELTYRGDTAIHLALKSYSMETLEFLISKMDDLNAKNEKGNTVLHLAVARKQFSVIKLLLSNPGVDVNSVNSNSLTPLDVLLESPQEYGDLVLGEMIRAAGGKTRAELVPSQHFHRYSISSESAGSSLQTGRTINKPFLRRSGSNEDIEKANLEPQKEEKKHNADILVVVAVLIATITFQAGINPPGGFYPYDADHKDIAGYAVLGGSLRGFLIFDVVALFLSVSVILLFLCVVPRKRKAVIKLLVWVLWLATIAAALAFTCAIGYIYVDSIKAVIILIVGWLMILMMGVIWVALRLVIILLKKGNLLEPIQRFSYSFMKRLLRCLRLNGAATEITNRLKNRPYLRRIVFALSIIFVSVVLCLICLNIVKIIIIALQYV